MTNKFDRFMINLGGGSIAPDAEMTQQQRNMRNRALLNAAEAILGATPTSAYDKERDAQEFIRLGTTGLAGFAEGYQNELQSARDAELANMKHDLTKMQLTEQKAMMEAKISAPKYGDVGDYNEWLRKTGQHYMKRGFAAKASEYWARLPLGSPKEERKFVVEQKKDKEKQALAYREAYNNFQQINKLLRLGKGQSDFAALMKTIKSLDDSVVRPSEKDAFDRAAGVVNVIESNLNQLKDGTLPMETVKNIYDMAFTAFEIYDRGYKSYVADETAWYDREYGEGIGARIMATPTVPQLQRYSLKELEAFREAARAGTNDPRLEEF